MTRIADLLAAGRTYSFEFFPPKSDAELSLLAATLRDLQPLAPSFVSVTYRGGPASRQRTYDLVTGMLHTTSLVPMAHLTCVAHSRLELAEILVNYGKAGVENLMALGGDPPEDDTPGELRHALELVELARAVGGFSVGVAAHPAGHPRSPDLGTDRRHLAAKLRLADFAVTQFFFEATDYSGLVGELAALGLDKPVLPGIMPITSLTAVPRMAAMGAAVPEWMVGRLEGAERRGGTDAVRREGIAMATELCGEVLAQGAPGLHFYTLNRSSATREIYRVLGLAPELSTAG
ncbi:MAG: methylenetetrahydrofolate reductase [Acidimicrobiales bacterium]